MRFISYPEPYTSATWPEWQSVADSIMSAAQADPSIHYIVTYGHRPAYSTGAHTGETRLATILSALGDKYSKYVLNLNGHSHDYERYAPIHGVVNITVSGGGSTLEPPWTATDPRTAFRAMHLEHVAVDVTSTSLTVQAICGPATPQDDTTCSQGSVLDSVTIAAPPDHDNPPAAAVSLSASSGAAPLVVTANASASSDSDATPIASYAYDFGDGTTLAAQANPTATHTYVTAGTYTVTVTVTDTAGRPATASGTVTVTPAQADLPPTAGLTVTPSAGTTPLTVTADASTSTDDHGIVSYAFDFGDGSSAGPQSGATATHVYTTAGTYTLTARVTDTGGQTSVATRPVTASVNDQPPVAKLAVRPATGPAPLSVTADASTSTDDHGIATYAFDFGDGSTAGPQAGATASHRYLNPGSYQLVVTVTDGSGQTNTSSVTVTSLDDPPPVAVLAVTPSTGRAPTLVTADASGSTDTGPTPIASYRFDFGDGTVIGPQAGATAQHTYVNIGTYTVSVAVTDTAGQVSTTTKSVKVLIAAGTNFVTNGGFETATTGWNVGGRTGITLNRVADGHTGTYAAILANTTSTTAADCTLNDSPDSVTKTDGGTYTASLWVKAPTAGAKLTLRIREYSGSTNVGQKTVTATLTTTWSQVSLPYTPTAAGDDLDLTAYLSNAAPGTCFEADDVTEAVS